MKASRQKVAGTRDGGIDDTDHGILGLGDSV